MNRLRYRTCLKIVFPIIALIVPMFFCLSAEAGYPSSASYCFDNSQIFWFIHITDIHIGTSRSQDSENLAWIINDAKSIIEPEFIVATGDLTDSTNGGLFPDGPHEEEWTEYRTILNGIDENFYYDIPGNHDAYNDQYFTWYCHYNLRNANYPDAPSECRTQLSWTREFSFGENYTYRKYHFLGVNTAGNDGRGFSLFFPYGDYAGLDTSELDFIQSSLDENSDADLTFIFGHHAMDSTPNVFGDTWIFYGATEFSNLLESYGISSYGYGHTHQFTEKFFTQGIDDLTEQYYYISPGIFYFNIASLGKSSNNQINITAVDCNGIATVTQAVRTWPIVLITSPMDFHLGSAPNPYAYSVPKSSANPLRALVFDANPVAQVQYQVDGSGTWNLMAQSVPNLHLWEALWDASQLSGGEHTIQVQAMSNSGTRTDSITVNIAGCSVDAECDDGLYCNGVETCVNGECQAGFPIDCNDNISCTDDSCSEANDDCIYTPNNTKCDDGIFCNGMETCDATAGCLPGTDITCPDDGYFCTGSEDCNEDIDACLSTGNPCPAGSTCNENTNSCEPSPCGNGVCEPSEDCLSCSRDCASGSGGGTCDVCFKGKCDGVCNPNKETTACSDCATSWCCGDGVCEGEEDSCICSIDCGPPPAIEANCTDGLDNDCNGFTDCEDSECKPTPACTCGAKKSQCSANSDCCSNRCSTKGVCL